MLKLSRKKKNACLALAVIATVLGGGSVWAAEHSTAIVESNNYGTAQRNYWTTKNISDGRGADNNTYTFNEDIVLKPNASTDSYINPATTIIPFRGIFKDGDNNSVINMNGHRLDVGMNYDKVEQPEDRDPALPPMSVDALNLYGLGVTSGNLTIKNVAGMNLTAKGDYMTAKSKLTGIYVAGTKSSNDSGKANLSIENADGWENAVKFHAADSGATQVQQGIYVWKNTGAAELNISGMVDVKLTDDANAIEVFGGYNPSYGKGSISAYIGGGLLESANYSAKAYGGELYINSKLDSEDNIVETAGSRDVQLKGNAYVADRYQDTGKLAVAFNTKDSYFQGVLANNNGNAWMALKNGATWTNKTVGQEAHGSSLKQFVGGDGTATTGYIFQNDSGKLNLGSYSGYTTIFYAHDNDGTETSHYTAGDTNVTSAKAGSNITLVTNEVDTTNDDTVKKALNALAGKLYYTGATKGENALEGIAAIAEGLTSSSKYLKTSNIYFDEATGQGTTKDNSKQTVTDFTTTLTGDNTTDSEYANGGVIADDGSYKFEKASTITTNNTYAINTSKDTVIKADKTLTLTTTGGSAAINTANKLDITAGKLSITTTSNNGGLNAGTYTARATVNINGDVDINASNNNSVYGIKALNADITVKGNVKAEIDGGLGGANYASVSAISSQGSSYRRYASNVTVNGDVDITANGNGLQANGNGAALTINGGGKITVNDTNAKGYSALRADNGTINMNVALTDGKATGGLGKEVVLKGNIAATNGTSDGKASVINLALDTKDSSLEGVSYTTAANNSEINLWLQNGASWTNEVHGATEVDYYTKKNIFTNSNVTRFIGGAGENTAGNILQKDSNKLTIGSYSGYTNIFYAHEGNGEAEANYTAGDTIITSAAAGSVVNLITDNTNITVDDKSSVANVLNALAGKLTYTNYTTEKNLIGYVKIAEGLTASSQTLKLGDMGFDENGKGYYAKPIETEFTTTLTGDADKDEEYKDGGVIAADGSYSFKQDSKITTNNAYAINTSKDTVIKADKTLTLTTTGGSAAINTTNKLDITAGKLSITTTSNKGGLNAGTYTARATVNINGDVDINASNNNSVYGVLATNADITVKGNVKAEIDGGLGGSNYASVSAISSQGNSYRKYASNVAVNGDVDITANGNGLQANSYGAALTINGGGKITVNDTNAKGYSALRADSGTINMNVKLQDGKATGGLGKDVMLKGNIAATNGTSEKIASVINLALDTKDSSLEGVSYTTAANNSEINLWLQNGAKWTNEVHGATEVDYYTKKNIFTNSNVTRFVGGAGEETAGNIFQKDSNKLTIGSYSGYTNIFYAHEGNGEAEANYTAGDTIITSAAAGSVVNLITDNTNVNMKSEDSVNNVLNSLAGKLTYSNYVNDENNLTGYVKIADGLTASSVTKQTGDIEFNKETGKGSLKADSVKPGVPDPDEQQTDKFDQAITGDDKLYKRQGVLKNGVYIFTKNPTEITVADGAAIDASTMDIVIDSSKAKLVMNGKDAGINADSKKVTISGTTEINGATGLNAANGAQITLKDGTTITGEQQAILADNAKVKLTGGSANTIKGDIFAQNGGNISINSELQAATTTIKGDVLVEDASADIALVGVHSKMNGGYALSGDKSKLTMTVKDGATWNVTSMEGTGLNLIGGETKGGSGYIVMPGADGVAAQSLRTTPANLDIANYQGWETIIYAHNNDGDEVSDYTAGDTIIRKAQAGSGVVLSTDNANINMEDKASVEATLKALAQKVTYSDHAANGKNLTGQVQIADGLTSSSASQYLGTMSWDQNGKGQYDLNSINWSAITEGDYETFVMKGVRSAATTSLHSWRDNMQDTYTGADLADEDGIFAKALGGKTSSDVKGVHDNNTYYGVQVGYDKALNDGWHTGVAFDYRDGDSKYLLGGEGDNQLYSLGVYGVKKFANDSFFRVAAKVGRVENEYDVYNEIRSTKLHGDYKANAYGLTMEYGKTIGKEEAYVTPKVQLTWSQVGSKSYTAATEAGAKLNVDQDSYQSLVGRLGFETGVKSSKGSVYAGFYAAHEFNGDISASYMAKDGGLKHTSFDGEDTWMEMSVGGRYSFNDNCHLYADFARDFNGDFQRKWKANVGLRFEF